MGEGNMIATIDREMRQRSSRRMDGNNWNWPVLDSLPRNTVNLWDLVGDGSCLFWNLLKDLNVECTVSNNANIQRQLNDYMLDHLDECIHPEIKGYTIRECILNNLRELADIHPGVVVVDEEDRVAQYI